MYSDRFSILFDQGLGRLAQASFSPATWRVLVHLIRALDFREWRHLPQASISAELGIGQAAASKALTSLTKEGLVERQRVRGVVVLRLSADFGWRGSAPAWHAHQQRRRAGRLAGEGGSPPETRPDAEPGAPESEASTEGRPGPAGAPGGGAGVHPSVVQRVLKGLPVDVTDLTRVINEFRRQAAAGMPITDLQRAVLRRHHDLPADERLT